MTGGTPKLDAATIIDSGDRVITIIGGILLDEGLEVFAGHAWRSKAARVADRRD